MNFKKSLLEEIVPVELPDVVVNLYEIEGESNVSPE